MAREHATIARALTHLASLSSSDLAATLLITSDFDGAQCKDVSSSERHEHKGMAIVANIIATQCRSASQIYINSHNLPLAPLPFAEPQNGDDTAPQSLRNSIFSIFRLLCALLARGDSRLVREVLFPQNGLNQRRWNYSFSQSLSQLASAARWAVVTGNANSANGRDKAAEVAAAEELERQARRLFARLLDGEAETKAQLLDSVDQAFTLHGGEKAAARMASAILTFVPGSQFASPKSKEMIQSICSRLALAYTRISDSAVKVDMLDAGAILLSQFPFRGELMSLLSASEYGRRLLADVQASFPQVALQDPIASPSLDWTALVAELHSENVTLRSKKSFYSSRRSSGKGKTRPRGDSFGIAPGTIATIQSVLPHLENERLLRRELARSKYAGKSSEEILQLLLDEEPDWDAVSSSAEPSSDSAGEDPIWQVRTTSAPSVRSTNMLLHRANIFDDTSLLSAKRLHRDRGLEEDATAGLTADLKRLILARAEADSDDEEEGNPFADLQPEGTRQEVGFEEELEDEPTGIWRRQRVSDLAGPRSDAREWRKRLQDWEGSESEGEGDSGAESAAVCATGSAANTKGTAEALSGAEAERAAERVLIRFYSDYGKAPFERNADARKSRARKELKVLLAKVENKGKAGWDDSMIESWCVMFERNPRKEKLLNASKDILLSGGNPNLAPVMAIEKHIVAGERDARGVSASSGRFGPDRGRAARIPGESRGGRGGGRGGRGGVPGQICSQPSGSASGGGSQSHAHRQKEKRGNQARQRGADRKAAKGFTEGGGA